MKNILVLAQALGDDYLETIENVLGKDNHYYIATGGMLRPSDIRSVINTFQHNALSFKGRLVSWYRYYQDVVKWVKANPVRIDIIYGISNPPINAWLGMKLKKRYHCKFIYMNWDIYPQIIEGSFKNIFVKIVCGFWQGLNSKIYPKIDCMLTIGTVMKESIQAKVKKEINIKVVPIAVDCKKIKPVGKKDNCFCEMYNLTDKFVVLYSGKMGYGHNIRIILEASKRFIDNNDIMFVLIGCGQRYAEIERELNTHIYKNVLLLPLQSDEMFPYSIACGDIGIVSQEANIAHLFMPSKTYSMMAAGMAIIGLTGDGKDDLKELLKEANCGRTVSGADAESLAEQINTLYHDKNTLDGMKRNARSYVLEHHDKAKAIEIYKSELKDIIS